MIIWIDKGRLSDKIQCSFMTKSLGGPGIGRNFHEEQLQIPRANIRLLCALLEPPSPFAVCSCDRCSHCTHEHCDSLQGWSQWHHLCIQISWWKENIRIMDLKIFLITWEIPWSFRYLFFLIDCGKAMTEARVSFVRVLVLKAACGILLWAIYLRITYKESIYGGSNAARVHLGA